MKFEVYTDESYITDERYRSIAAFSYNADQRTAIHNELNEILHHSNVREFKWSKLSNAKYKICALKLINFILKNITKYDIRIDVLTWDTYDSRHKVKNRDDQANFERLFFHLLKTCCKKRPKNSIWDIYPDQRHGIDWDTVNTCLNAEGNKREFQSSLFGDFYSDPYYQIHRFSEIDSTKEPCCHIADLFAGLSVFSINSYSKYKKWVLQNQPSLFETETEAVDVSNSEQVRFEVMQKFNTKCKNLKLGVSLDRNQCFLTYDHKKPINFWWYKPQHQHDKAPKK